MHGQPCGPVATDTPTKIITETFTRSATSTSTPTDSETETPTLTETSTLTATPTDSETQTLTSTPTATPTDSETATLTCSSTPSLTSTETAVKNPNKTPKATHTPVPTKTPKPPKPPKGTETMTPTETPVGGAYAVSLGKVTEESPVWQFGEKDLAVVPNPASFGAYVHYRIGNQASVRILMIGLTGDLIEKIELGERPAGTGSRWINFGDLSSGVYVMILQSDEGLGFVTKAKFKLAVAK
jgi:hypothetical protein